MKMKKIYSSPEFEFIKLKLLRDVLIISDPDPGVNTGSGTGQDNPGEDPFGDGGW